MSYNKSRSISNKIIENGSYSDLLSLLVKLKLGANTEIRNTDAINSNELQSEILHPTEHKWYKIIIKRI